MCFIIVIHQQPSDKDIINISAYSWMHGAIKHLLTVPVLSRYSLTLHDDSANRP